MPNTKTTFCLHGALRKRSSPGDEVLVVHMLVFLISCSVEMFALHLDYGLATSCLHFLFANVITINTYDFEKKNMQCI